MYEADSQTSLHDFSIWVLYFNLVLGKFLQYQTGLFQGNDLR